MDPSVRKLSLSAVLHIIVPSDNNIFFASDLSIARREIQTGSRTVAFGARMDGLVLNQSPPGPYYTSVVSVTLPRQKEKKSEQAKYMPVLNMRGSRRRTLCAYLGRGRLARLESPTCLGSSGATVLHWPRC